MADKRNDSVTIVEERPSTGSAAARRAMSDSQLRTSGVNADWVLQRMADVAREAFVPDAARGHAYIDRAIALGGGRFLPAPAVHGMMLQEARPSASDRALVIDGGSGYLAELVRPLVASLETATPAQAAAASKRGDFTLLVIDGAVAQLPAVLVKRLAEGARVLTGWQREGVTCLAAGRKAGADVALLPLAEMGIPVLPEFAARKGWSF
ncbi:MAG: protein-L-isoaspartate O-methyltransferase [Croceibacterium sp.]